MFSTVHDKSGFLGTLAPFDGAVKCALMAGEESCLRLYPVASRIMPSLAPMRPSSPSTQLGMGDVLRRNAPIDDFHNSAATAESVAINIAAMTLLQTGS